jgi:hypothetical protein
MGLAAALRGTGAVTSDAHPFSLIVGGSDLIGSVTLESASIEDGDNGRLDFSVWDGDSTLSVVEWAPVRFTDNDQDITLFGGFVLDRTFEPTHGANGRWIHVHCVGNGILLDKIVTPPYDSSISPWTIGGFVTAPDHGPRDHFQRAFGLTNGTQGLLAMGNAAADLDGVATLASGAGAPANVWESLVLRKLPSGRHVSSAFGDDPFTIEATHLRQFAEELISVSDVSNEDETYGVFLDVDPLGYIRWDWLGEKIGNAPYAITDVSPDGVTSIAAESLTYETDSAERVNSVYVKGSSPANSLFVRDHANIKKTGRELMAVLDRSTSATSVNKARRAGRAYLASTRESVVRGRFTVTGFNGFKRRQLVTITDSRVGLSAVPYIIHGVRTRFLRGDGLRAHEISFGGGLSRRLSHALARVAPLP